MSTKPFVVSRRNSTSSVLSPVLTLLIGALSCGPKATPSSNSQRVALGSGVLASVADSRIALQSVERAVTKGHTSPNQALMALVEVRALAHFAEHGGLDQGRLHAARRAVLARVLLERIEAASRLPESPTDAEVSVITEQRWIAVDRPEARATCHAVVHKDSLDDASGEALAQRLSHDLRPHRNCKDFINAARAFPVAGVKITSESLMPVTADGRTIVLNTLNVPVDEGTPLDKEFARAVFEINAQGEQSGIVRTTFGWHIILYASTVERKHVPLEERRRIFMTDILLDRARRETDRVIGECRRARQVVVERAALETIGRVQVGP